MKNYQIGGTHYIEHKIQPWHIVDEYGLDYYLGNSIKYILRKKGESKENRVEDIKKAIHYLEKYLSNLELESESKTKLTVNQTPIYEGFAESFFGLG